MAGHTLKDQVAEARTPRVGVTHLRIWCDLFCAERQDAASSPCNNTTERGRTIREAHAGPPEERHCVRKPQASSFFFNTARNNPVFPTAPL
jgi:hypothetical protein